MILNKDALDQWFEKLKAAGHVVFHAELAPAPPGLKYRDGTPYTGQVKAYWVCVGTGEKFKIEYGVSDG